MNAHVSASTMLRRNRILTLDVLRRPSVMAVHSQYARLSCIEGFNGVHAVCASASALLCCRGYLGRSPLVKEARRSNVFASETTPLSSGLELHSQTTSSRHQDTNQADKHVLFDLRTLP